MPKIKLFGTWKRANRERTEAVGIRGFKELSKFVYHRFNFHTCKNKGINICNNSRTNFERNWLISFTLTFQCQVGPSTD